MARRGFWIQLTDQEQAFLSQRAEQARLNLKVRGALAHMIHCVIADAMNESVGASFTACQGASDHIAAPNEN
jgi:hypothetical protein